MESINDEWEEILALLRRRYPKTGEGIRRYCRDRKNLDREIRRQGREYEWEHLLVYYSFLCLARCVDDYDFLGKAKLAVVSFLMIRDMDSACYGEHEGVYTKEDCMRTARIYAKQVEHSAVNLDYLADEILFEDMYTRENLCASLTIV
jgi:lysine-N-methylase